MCKIMLWFSSILIDNFLCFKLFTYVTIPSSKGKKLKPKIKRNLIYYIYHHVFLSPAEFFHHSPKFIFVTLYLEFFYKTNGYFHSHKKS